MLKHGTVKLVIVGGIESNGMNDGKYVHCLNDNLVTVEGIEIIDG